MTAIGSATNGQRRVTAAAPPVADTAQPAGQPAARVAGRVRRRELAAFLRSRRERISPQQVGLPSGGRRRTPGLRREEVAQLAGVGVTWYTWLEQGREIRPSPQVLDAIARALQLDAYERSHLFTLADTPLVDAARECRAVPPAIHTLLSGLQPYPAAVYNARYDLLAYNRSYCRLWGDLDALPFEERNTLWLAFTSPAFRAVLVDWDDAVRRMVAQYRAAMAEHISEPAWKCLVKRLQAASPEFATLWRRHDVAAPENLDKRFLHARLGLLRFTHTNLWLGPRVETRMATYTPADAETAAKLAELDTLPPQPLVGSVPGTPVLTR